MSLKGLCNKF